MKSGFNRPSTVTQLLMVITDARSIANAYMHTIMEFHMRDRVCYECTDLHPVPLKGKCHIFCSRKAAQSRICKIAVRYDRQTFPIFSVNLNWNPSDPWSFQLMVYKCGR